MAGVVASASEAISQGPQLSLAIQIFCRGLGMTTTKLIRNDGTTIQRGGTSGFTVTGTLHSGNEYEVLIDFDQATLAEGRAMVGTLLTQLEEMFGEGYVAACIAHYAEDTGKALMEAGDHKIAMVRGYRRAKRK